MIISSQGFGHFTEGLNNQDFGLETSQMLLVLDGCSGAKYSEVGTRLFAQLFAKKEGYEQYEKFETNVKEIFEDLLGMMSKYYSTEQEMEKDFIMENLLFTILACFQTEEKYIVKLFGDGYIITENMQGCISYMRFSYGKFPPYFAYKYCKNMNFQEYSFKTFEFDKKVFKRVGIASDGILPIVKGEVQGVESFIKNENELMMGMTIRSQRQSFYDDVTIGILNSEGGKKNEVVSI